MDSKDKETSIALAKVAMEFEALSPSFPPKLMAMLFAAYARGDKGISSSELSEILNLAKGGVSRLCNQLTNEPIAGFSHKPLNLAVYGKTAESGRFKTLRLNDTGKALCEKLIATASKPFAEAEAEKPKTFDDLI